MRSVVGITTFYFGIISYDISGFLPGLSTTGSYHTVDNIYGYRKGLPGICFAVKSSKGCAENRSRCERPAAPVWRIPSRGSGQVPVVPRGPIGGDVPDVSPAQERW